MNTSLIITTYNNPVFLEMVLLTVKNQVFKQNPETQLEVIIADDGSTAATQDLIIRYKKDFPYPLIHVWQEDLGFRAAKIRNLAAIKASGEYLIYIDGDCLLAPDFIDKHISLKEDGFFVSGGRIILGKNYTNKITQNLDISITQYGFWQYLGAKLSSKTNKLFPRLRFKDSAKWRKNKSLSWEKHKTCNLALFKQDIFDVNGFDEAFAGWGYEDSDLVVRLIHNGVFAKNGRFGVSVFHMWHKENARDKEDINYARLLEHVNDKNFVVALAGIKENLGY